jgi:glycosyltransferase involved in cell wall biosynthesis
MKNLLFISSYPFPLYKGSNQHAFFFIKSLTSIFNVYCIFFIQPENRKEFQDNLRAGDLDIKDYAISFFKEEQDSILFAKISKNKYYVKIRRIFHFPYYYMNMATHDDGKRLIQRFTKQYSIDVVHVEHFHYAKYLFDLSPEIKKVVVYHDLYHRIHWDQFKIDRKITARFFSILACLKKYLFERILSLKTDLNIFLNPVEMEFFSKRTVCIPHIVNPEIKYSWSVDKGCINILFLGGYNHPPNRVSVKYIVDSILPLLAKRSNDFKIWIIGPGAEKYEEIISGSPYRDLICLKGFVPDINDVFQNMDVALFPILYGGGIKTKVIEAMAAGLPVLTTPQGVFGLRPLPENCVEVCQSPDDFLRALIMLKQNVTLRKERSLKGKEFISRYHSVEMLPEKIKDAYMSLF